MVEDGITIARSLRDMAEEAERLAELAEAMDAAPGSDVRGIEEPRWMTIARGWLGTKEVDPGSNPSIEAFHAATRGGSSTDDVPWCASFVNYCLQQAGIKGTRTKRARDFEAFGMRTTFRYGCLVVFWRGSPHSGAGHVGFGVAEVGEQVWVLGGNQSARRAPLGGVNIKPYSADRLLTYRWPSIK